MTHTILTRRMALLGGVALLGGCSALSALDAAAVPLDTYDLQPTPGATTGPRSAATLLVTLPEAAAPLSTDRLMIRPQPASITYLPDARWSDTLPIVIQSILIRSIAGTGRVGFVGRTDGGPVPDRVLLVRIDRFEVAVTAPDTFTAQVDITLTAIDDRTQAVIGGRTFAQMARATDASPAAVVAAFQRTMDVLTPAMADWAVGTAG
ncbi:cholesterol transport system auxiliary component [Loktanella fryxellensis]|uniref:Cholesterol transport system auxiliary component n=1 Tax=Loktanella fryxellensis TaxID=245187 RepID=A0A1H8HIE1_9RHOB|nr:ABC-type transport auxiliary lipoprotein family protein [Loktanella fryxellensis]SEN55727.1 cholesterol transport system auxiliary component [Loktanella fryxellensis]